MRRAGYALFVLAGLSVIIAVVSLGYAIGGPSDMRTRAFGYGMVNVGFAVVNVMLGFVLLMGSRAV
jgi:hypothetical protein